MPIAALISFVAAILAVAILLRGAHRLPVATPNERSLHSGPVSRVGGLAIIAGVLAGIPGGQLPPGVDGLSAAVIGVALGIVAVVSLVDDWRGTRPSTRLAVQLVAAIAVAWVLPVAGAAAILVVMLTMWMANLFNFIDGNDGLAVSAAICGFLAYAFAAHLAGASALPFVCVVLACLPFLAVNLPPARMFMGDVGSVTLGFAAAVLGIAGVLAGTWPAWLPLLAFITPILDATLTLVARALHGEALWRAHKLHYYQRFHQLGAGHRGTLLLYAALSVATSASAIACVTFAPRRGWMVLLAWVLIVALLFGAIDYHWRRRSSSR